MNEGCERESKLTEKIKTNSKRLADLSIRIAGIRGLLFSTKLSNCDNVDREKQDPYDVNSEIEYQTMLINEIESDLLEIERRF